jgi:tellurite resistance protein TerC
MIGVGAVLLSRFSWMTYLFGAFLIFTAARLLVARREEIHPEGNLLLRIARRFFPVTKHFEGRHFFLRRSGKIYMTPLFVVLLLLEGTDIVFAVDSIPAVFAVTREPIIVFTSNVFAILGCALSSRYSRGPSTAKYLKTA